MWSIILCLLAAVLGVLIGLLLRCEWSPVVRRRYINLGWEDGMRWWQRPDPRAYPSIGYGLAFTGHRSYGWPYTNTHPTTELDMSRRRFDYYMTGYEQALDYKREREGIIATRKTHLERIQRLDTEIRKAHHELTEEA